MKKVEIIEIISDIDIASEILEKTKKISTPPVSTHKMRIQRKTSKIKQNNEQKQKQMEEIRDIMISKESKTIYKDEIVATLGLKPTQVSRFAYSFNKFLMEDKEWALKRGKDANGLYYYLVKYGE